MKKFFSNKILITQIIVLCCLLITYNSQSQILEAWSRSYNNPSTTSDVGEHIAVDN